MKMKSFIVVVEIYRVFTCFIGIVYLLGNNKFLQRKTVSSFWGEEPITQVWSKKIETNFVSIVVCSLRLKVKASNMWTVKNLRSLINISIAFRATHRHSLCLLARLAWHCMIDIKRINVCHRAFPWLALKDFPSTLRWCTWAKMCAKYENAISISASRYLMQN